MNWTGNAALQGQDKVAQANRLRALARESAAQNDFDTAIRHYRETLTFFPANAGIWEEMARCYLAAGKNEEAILIFARLSSDYPNQPGYRVFLAHALQCWTPSGAKPFIRDALRLCLAEKNLSHQWIAKTWTTYLGLDPLYKDLLALAFVSDADFSSAFAGVDPKVLNDPLLIMGMHVFVCPDATYESLYTRTRREILKRFCSKQPGIDGVRPLAISLAAQNFLNEYVLTQAPEETAMLANLRDARSDWADPATEDRLTVLAAYQPLSLLLDNPGFLAYAQRRGEENDGFAMLLRQQVLEPLREKDIAANIKAMGAITDTVSRAVSKQYEENPYPRWRGASAFSGMRYAVDTRYLNKPGEKLRILIAGCGTGQQIAYTAQAFPDAHITAIDLSRASLAFAQRKHEEIGYAATVRYLQMDILDLPQLKEEFDFVICTGVLHHMRDPMQGWRTLCDVSVPNALMKIGLYSARARENVVHARSIIAREGFEATTEGIRTCRDYLKKCTDWPRPGGLGHIPDFYSTSACRDLIFHTQEHRFSLLDIMTCLKTLNLKVIRFDSPTAQSTQDYAAAFPDDSDMTNLENWHVLEERQPDLFVGMYQFHVKKLGSSAELTPLPIHLQSRKA